MPVSTDQINVNWTLENLETRIKDNSEYINSLIGLIPPKYYFKNDPNNDETNSNTKINDEFQPNKRKRFSKQELKKQKKEAKKQKLDPNNLKTVLDIHKERLLNINQQKSSIDNDDDDDDDDGDDDDKEISDDNDDFDDDKSESEIDNEEKSNQSIHQLQPKVQISTAERLARIRQVKESSSSQSLIKSNSKKSKQKRKSEEKKKKKQKSKTNKQLKKESVNNNNNNNNKEALHNDDDDVADDGNKKIKFAKFDFEQKNKKTKKQDNIHLINKLKKKSENFKKLERKDPEKAMIVKEKDAWNKVFRKAEGEKVKDDLKLLKKTVKRGAIKKKKSEKSWNERIETIAKNINEKQEKRKSNIQTRIEEKKKKKMKKRK